ncbi:GNAT family N-acetyltransferase [Streptomyces sp. NPDC086010]|uniref:GNAT family N-acetyltransferase n=1 Tax=Streptomyces sp. NPDC086010 TaxID=3365745 RepID=UPI0037D3D3F0
MRVLADVHQSDRYPLNWPDQPDEWLSSASLLGAWVVEVGGHLVGHVSLSSSGEGDLAPDLWSARNGTPKELTAVVSRLFVAPQARGHRVGALLIGRAVEEARRQGLHPVLDVVASDTAAATLYEALGWERIATVEQRWSPSQLVAIHCYAAAQ